jgi:redox-sensitive bicupin YhaK (pirin superfamily)
MTIEILHRDDLLRGGFAGLKEHQMVMDPKVFGPYANPRTWPGIGNFVYLADAKFDPHGETQMHDHREIDVISVMVEGNISHEGSLEHGQGLNAFDVQVQRAGGEGFSHNEINPDNATNRMIQLWILPEKPGQPAGYKMYTPKWGEIARVYGGSPDQTKTFDSRTLMDVGLLNPEQKVVFDSEFIAYLTLGSGIANGEEIEDGDLIRGTRLEFTANEKSQLIVIHF